MAVWADVRVNVYTLVEPVAITLVPVPVPGLAEALVSDRAKTPVNGVVIALHISDIQKINCSR